jgi:alkylation response protein AidB-like acyl-CoA dehydrogenase
LTHSDPRKSSQRVQRSFQHFVENDGLTIPLPGHGETWSRFEALASEAAADLSVGRLIEGHVDALAILDEARMKPFDESATYGVWAARTPVGGTIADVVPGGWLLGGSKPFCSGSGIIDRALVTAETPDGYRIFDISLKDHVAAVHEDSWPAVGMADSQSHTLEFDGPVITGNQAVGPPGFYVNRPGFWFGAAGVAACWFGGAVGLVGALVESLAEKPSEHVLSDLGIAVARLEAMREVLRSVANAIDNDPEDSSRRAHFRALVVRQVVHDGALEVLERVGSAGGARPLCHDESQSRRAADLFVYLSQHHGGSDAAELGKLAKDSRSWR